VETSIDYHALAQQTFVIEVISISKETERRKGIVTVIILELERIAKEY
jgi:hypothetical protein